MSFKLAMAQMSVTGGAVNLNLGIACRMIRDAAAAGCQVVLLPEALDTGWTHPSGLHLAEPIPGGSTYRTLADAAARHRLIVCAGLTERSGGRVYNSAVIIDQHGELVLLHRKLNELEIGQAFYAQGDRLGVAHTDVGVLGLMICADGFAHQQAISQTLGYMGADMILSPCAWAVTLDHDNTADPYGSLWRDVYGVVCRQFGVWIVGVSCVGEITEGPWTGHRCIGCSMAVDPDGHVACQGPYGGDAEALLTLDIDLLPRPARGAQWADVWNRTHRPNAI